MSQEQRTARAIEIGDGRFILRHVAADPMRRDLDGKPVAYDPVSKRIVLSSATDPNFLGVIRG